MICIWFVGADVSQLCLHFGVQIIMNRMRGRGYNIRYAIMVGSQNFAQQFHAHLLAKEGLPFEVVGHLAEPE